MTYYSTKELQTNYSSSRIHFAEGNRSNRNFPRVAIVVSGLRGTESIRIFPFYLCFSWRLIERCRIRGMLPAPCVRRISKRFRK